MNIVTGYRGEAHITSQQDQAKNQGIFGSGSYVLDVGQKLRAEAVSANEVRIYDGVLSHQGVVAVVEKNTYDSVTITSGSQGADRCDLIVARYTKEGSTGVESMTFEVIMGMEGSSTPPDYNTGDIQAGDSPVDMPIYEVHLSGIQIESLVPVASQIGNVNGAFTMNDILPSGDVNAATTPGAYELVSTNTYTNLPTGITSGVLTVSKAREGGFITHVLSNGTSVYTRTLSGGSWGSWMCSVSAIENMTVTYTSNSYITQSDLLSGMTVYKRGGIAYIRFNVNVATEIPASKSAFEIGRIEGFSAPTEWSQNIMAMTGNGLLVLTITTGGIVRVTTSTLKAPATRYRCGLAIPLSN